MVGAHKNCNGSRDLTTPFQEWFVNQLATVNPPTKFEVSNSTHYKDMKSDTKCRKRSGWGHSRSLEIAPIDTAHTSSY